MKKIIITSITALTIVAALTGCNMSLGPGNYNFRKIHVDTHNYSGCFTIEKWYNDASGIEVKTKESGSMYFAEGMYMLIEDNCPFCNEEEHNADKRND